MGSLVARVPYGSHRVKSFVPDWIVLYAFLGLADFGLTLAAFEFGASEANPFLSSLQLVGLFEFVKLSLTLLIVCIGYRLRFNRTIHASVVIGNAVMVAITVYHVSNFLVFA